jgi:xylulose-5-phosphate/fructose-6-phosphate phosphoketolase
MNNGSGTTSYSQIRRRIRATNYITVAQLFLQDNYLLQRPLSAKDIKPRLLGHWGTCPGLNVTYANLKAFYHSHPDFHIVIGPGHGFPALQANLFYDNELQRVDAKATPNLSGLSYLCHAFSWPGGYPSHASPVTPDVICEGGELGYALATAYGYAMGRPRRMVAVVVGDGEFETATALASLNLPKLLSSDANGRILPILHLNGYKISAPTIAARKSERELLQLLKGFGYTPLLIQDDSPEVFQSALASAQTLFTTSPTHPPFLIYQSDKGATGPATIAGTKISGNYRAHQIPLPQAKLSPAQLSLLERWLQSYHFDQLFDSEKGFIYD